MGRSRNKIVRLPDGDELARLREVLEAITGAPVSRSKAAGSAVTHMRTCLGEGEDVALFSVGALQRLMHDRTKALTGQIAQTVATEVTRYLQEAGIDAELMVGLSDDGRTVAAKMVSTVPADFPIGDAEVTPTIEA